MKKKPKPFRYPGIKPFTKDQESIFFGRDEDIQKLSALIILEKLVVLFSKSGYGKSSLLNAGIAPHLERENQGKGPEYIPVFIRFNTWNPNLKNNPDWFKRFTFHFSKKIPIRNKELYESLAFLPATLWGEVKRRHSGNGEVYVFIFDQFEEFFTFPTEQQNEFKLQLGELLYADFPVFLDQYDESSSEVSSTLLYKKVETKVVFAIRSDRLGELHRLKDRLPAILHKRYELTTLNEHQAKEALENPATLVGNFVSPPFSFATDTLDYLMQQLRPKDHIQDGVEAFQLQIIAQNIETRVIHHQINGLDSEHRPLIQKEDLPPLENIYRQYYQDKIEELPKDKRLLARKVIENGLLLLDPEGNARRVTQDGDVLKQNYKIDQELLNGLENTFLLRREANSMNGFNYELSHDTLTIPIRIAKQEREAAEKLTQEKLDNQRLRKKWIISIAFWATISVVLGSFLFWALDQRQKANESLAKYEKLDFQRREQEFALTFERAEMGINFDESGYPNAKIDVAKLDTIITEMDRLLQTSMTLKKDTRVFKEKIKSLKQKINYHED